MQYFTDKKPMQEYEEPEVPQIITREMTPINTHIRFLEDVNLTYTPVVMDDQEALMVCHENRKCYLHYIFYTF